MAFLQLKTSSNTFPQPNKYVDSRMKLVTKTTLPLTYTHTQSANYLVSALRDELHIDST